MAGSSHLGYRLKAQKAGSFEYLRPTRKTTILKMCNAQGQCCCQNTGPRESAGSSDLSCRSASGVQTGQNALDDSQQDELKGNQARRKKGKQTDTVTKMK